MRIQEIYRSHHVCLQLPIEAYVTREKEPATDNHKPLQTVWFKPNALDAPVSGGDVGAKNGTLTIMVGGDEATFNQVKPVLEVMGSQVKLFGGPGKGQHTKMANQIMIAGTMTGMVEMFE